MARSKAKAKAKSKSSRPSEASQAEETLCIKKAKTDVLALAPAKGATQKQTLQWT
jgi:hypothetical protein